MFQTPNPTETTALITGGSTLLSAVLSGTAIWFWQQGRNKILTKELELEKQRLLLQATFLSTQSAKRCEAFQLIINTTVAATVAAKKIYGSVGSTKDAAIGVLVSQIPIIATSLDEFQKSRSNASLRPEELEKVVCVRDALVEFVFALSFDEKADDSLISAFNAFIKTSESLEKDARGEVNKAPQLQEIIKGSSANPPLPASIVGKSHKMRSKR